jgi:hypothetical protein
MNQLQAVIDTHTEPPPSPSPEYRGRGLSNKANPH